MSRERELLERTIEEWDSDRDLYEFHKVMEEIRAYLAKPEVKPFVRLSEEEVSQILSSAHTPYEAICATENRLVKKNIINKSNPDSVDLQSRCRGDKL